MSSILIISVIAVIALITVYDQRRRSRLTEQELKQEEEQIEAERIVW